MANKTYIIVHDVLSVPVIDGVCDSLEQAENLCAVYNESAWKNGKCFDERRVMKVNKFAPAAVDGQEILHRVTIQFPIYKNGRIGPGKVEVGVDAGVCYYAGNRSKPSVTASIGLYHVHLYISGPTPDDLIDRARAVLDQYLEEQGKAE